MKAYSMVMIALILGTLKMTGQQEDCFFLDFEPKTATIPPYTDYDQTTAWPSVDVWINYEDTVAPVSKYLFGTSATLYTKQYPAHQTLVDRVQTLSPTLIRFPGGSLANVYFWDSPRDNPPSDVPDSIVNADGEKEKLWPWYGGNTDSWTLSLDNYYHFRDSINTSAFLSTKSCCIKFIISSGIVAPASINFRGVTVPLVPK